MSLYQNRSVAILMCTYNGEAFLEEQLDSIQHQNYKNWRLYVNDDGSKDATLDILKQYQKKWGVKKLIIRQGPKKGFSQNFLQIIKDPKIKADLYFLSDQDDIWMPHKLSYTINKISKLDPLKPNLYCARTTYVSSDAKHILGQSDLFMRQPSFKNAIVQSIAGGNTMAFNNRLKIIVSQFKADKIVSHDWWLYILNEFFDGVTFYDSKSTIFYRQHSNSLIGSNTTMIGKLKRLRMLIRGVYRDYNSIHLDNLNQMHTHLSRAQTKFINEFSIKRDKAISERFRMIEDLGLYRQTWDTHLALYLGAILHKL